MAAKSAMAFRILTMAVNMSRLTTGTTNVNTGNERTSNQKPVLYFRFNQLEVSAFGDNKNRYNTV